MKLFRKIYDYFHYLLDSFNTTIVVAKIERFTYDLNQNRIIVSYRLGRNKLSNKMALDTFEKELFEKVSIFDQHRLTKFSILQAVIQSLFQCKTCKKEDLIDFIQKEAKDDLLF